MVVFSLCRAVHLRLTPGRANSALPVRRTRHALPQPRFFIANHKLADITSTQGACVRPRLICTYVTHNNTTALSGGDVCQGCFISSFMWLTCSFLFLLSHICFLLNSLSCNFIGIAVYVWGGVLNQIKMLKKFNLLRIEQLYTVKCIILYTHTHTHTHTQVQQNDSNRTGHR